MLLVKNDLYKDIYRKKELLINKQYNALSRLYFNKKYPIHDIPAFIKVIIFGNMFDNLIDNIPDHIEKIHLGVKFNQTINNLPNSLLYLTLININYNKSLNYLPASIINLTLNSSVLITLNNLPSSLKQMSLGIVYFNYTNLNKNLENNLPKLLVLLCIDYFNQSIKYVNINKIM